MWIYLFQNFHHLLKTTHFKLRAIKIVGKKWKKSLKSKQYHLIEEQNSMHMAFRFLLQFSFTLFKKWANKILE